VLDFGIAKLAPELAHLSPRTRTGALLGTPAYMAPEQISGSAIVDERTDVYAAGIVLYEAVTGRVPFVGETLFDLMRQHMDDPPPPPSQLRRDLPPGIEHVILRALEKHPARRFPTAIAMGDALVDGAAQLVPEQWRALVRGSTITGGRQSITKIGTKIRSTPAPRTRSPRQSQEPPTTALRKPRASAPPPTPDLALAPPTVAAPPPRPARKSRAGLVVAIVLSAAVATGITLLAVADGDEPAPGSGSLPDPPRPADSVPPVVIGGGSAADHGVHIGSNVITGGNVVIGTAGRGVMTQKADYNPKRFDPIAFIPRAVELGRQIYPDADFTELQFYSNVRPDGSVDLTIPEEDSYIELRSRSKSSKTGGACYLMIEPGEQLVTVRVRHDEKCDHPIRAIPKCSFAQVWAEAKRRGRTGSHATIGFLSDGTWFFDADRDTSGGVETIEDCK
jgi:hypothetical protein